MSDDVIRLDDLFRAFAELKPGDADARRGIAALLGFSVEQPKTAQRLPPVPEKKTRDRERRAEATPWSAPATVPPPPRVTPTSTTEKATILRPVRRAAAAEPEWMSTIEPLAMPQAPSAPPALQPLFLPRWTRGILVASTAVAVDTGPVDVAAVVAAISRGREFRRVPRREVMRMAGTVQVLVDASESMVPFSEDQGWLVDRIVTTAGRDRIKVLGIEGGEPFLAGEGPRFEWSDYFAHHVPPPGVAVILISDLGIGRVPLTRVASPAQWASFARELRRRSCQLVGIVPYPPARWPAVVRRAMPIVQWDSGTTARSARKAIGRSLRMRRNE